ncbi:amino acid ABC transporter permease [Rhizobium sp. YTU87027]|uniref:amino acid ABC transporter permease n=1 Tax=Rhizobium sp. YTU87027 TaxID=3417741 RepID=UPI003D682276
MFVIETKMELLNLDVIRTYGFVLLQGLGNTVLLTLIVIVLAGVLAIPLALIRTSQHLAVRLPFEAFVEIIRGTPLILQLFYVYYVLPSAGLQLDPFAAAVVALTINYTAFLSEVYRGGIKSVPDGQRNAGSRHDAQKSLYQGDLAAGFQDRDADAWKLFHCALQRHGAGIRGYSE